MRTKPSFQCRALSKAFPTRNGPIWALDGVSFEAREQDFLCVVGPSGCGKTTLLRLIAGLLSPTSGEIAFSGFPDGQRPSTALVFQQHALFPWMSVLDNVAFALEMRRVPRGERLQRAGGFIDKMGLGKFARNYPHEISVGMQQRTNLARAFVADPDILLMDEPLGSLDFQTKLVLQQELLRIWKEHRKLVVYVTHDIREAVLLGDRVLVMSGHPGRIREELPVPLSRPRNLTGTDDPALTRMVRHVWDLLEDEVRKTLWLSERTSKS